MASKRSSAAVQAFPQRAGEGYAIDVVTVATNGDTVTGQLDLSSLPVPDRRFSCDAVGIARKGPLIQLLFAQSQPVGAGLLSMLAVNMNPESVRHFLSAVAPDFDEQFTLNVPGATPAEVTAFTRAAEQSVVLTASIVMAGYNGNSGCMDFYYASPFAIQQIAIVKKLSVEPVVRVNLPSQLVFAILKAMRHEVSMLPLAFSEISQ